MKIKINRNQLKLLSGNFIIVEGHGLIHNEDKLIKESMREFKIKFILGGWLTEITIGSYTFSSAMQVVKAMFPKAMSIRPA